MIKHHPKFELLQAYVNGELPASLAAGIAMHAEMCPKCQEQITLLTEQIAESQLGLELQDSALTANNSIDEDLMVTDFELSLDDAGLGTDSDADFTAMIADITSSDERATVTKQAKKTIEFKGEQYPIPSAIANIEVSKPANIGKLSRARLQLDEGEIHSSLLHIGPGGSVPEHTHKGFELTLLLEGSFTDDKGTYVRGDFIMLDKSHHHQPISEEGCLCYTVANDALHFTQGINKLLNPIGSFIY